MDTELHGAFSASKIKAQGVGVYGIESFRSFSAHFDSIIETSSCTPWQYCRTYGLDFRTSSTNTGVRGAAGGRQPAAANTPCKYAPGRDFLNVGQDCISINY